MQDFLSPKASASTLHLLSIMFMFYTPEMNLM